LWLKGLSLNTLPKICFSVSNILIQDGNCGEYGIGNRSSFILHGATEKPLIESDDKKSQLLHVADNRYAIRGYVYETTCDYALMNLGIVKITLCNHRIEYQEGKMYEGEVSFEYDIWSCYGMNVCEEKNDDALYVEGITQQIRLVTALEYDNITLEHTSSWEDGESNTNAISSYLIDVVLCADKILEPEQPRLQMDKNRLVVRLDGLSSYKIDQIKAFIEKIL
jgi:hypothetical protein